MNKMNTPRLFLDSNILTGGSVARWGLDKAILSLCAARTCQLVLAEVVREEVERNLLKKALAAGKDRQWADQLLADYDKFLQLANPEIIPFPDKKIVTEHFTQEVAQKTGLRITTAPGFFRNLVESSIKEQDED